MLKKDVLPLIKRLCAYYQRRREYQHLLTLDDRLLRDMGICRAYVQREVHRPFWKK